MQSIDKFINVTQLITKPLKQLKSLEVTCGTCPVSFRCFSEQEVDSQRCMTCNIVSVGVPGVGLVAIDCQQHGFKLSTNAPQYTVKQCEWCAGIAALHDMMNASPPIFLLSTVYSVVGLKERARVLKAATDYYTDCYALLDKQDKNLDD